MHARKCDESPPPSHTAKMADAGKCFPQIANVQSHRPFVSVYHLLPAACCRLLPADRLLIDQGHQQGETKRDNPVFTESAAVKVSYVLLRQSTPSRHNHAIFDDGK